MKTNFIVPLVLAFVISLSPTACVVSPPRPAVYRPEPGAVVVKVLDTPLPQEEDLRAKFLWNHFANQPEERQFNTYTVEHWRNNYAVFAATLVQKAKDQQLDAGSLRQSLNTVLNDAVGDNDIAFLPVGAYQASLDGNPVWIIVVKWEYPSAFGKEAGLGHIRVFAFDQKTQAKVAFVKCT